VELDGKRLLDGGIADSIPLAYFESVGYTRNVVVLTKPLGYRKHKTPRISRLLLRKLPAVAEAMAKRHAVYNETVETIEKREALGEIFVLRPDAPLPIGHTSHSRKKLQRVYELGRTVGTRRLPELLRFLDKKSTAHSE
jgi:predicted patatin/cPLA2 family phospholipase